LRLEICFLPFISIPSITTTTTTIIGQDVVVVVAVVVVKVMKFLQR